MNALLVYPKYPDTFWSFKHALRFISKKALHPPLGLLTVAAMLPQSWEKRLIDMNVDQLDDANIEWADIVFLGAMAVQKASVQDVVKRCRKAGVRVVAGGPLFTAAPGDFHDVDHLVLNEAEITLPAFLRDLEKGNAGHLYDTMLFSGLDNTPIPLWRLIKMKNYVSMNIQYSRGCPFDCEFCDITVLYGRKTRTKPADRILAELDSLHSLGWRGNVFFVDDNFIGNKKKLKEKILPAMIDWMKMRRYPFDFATEVSINLADDDMLLKLMIQAGFDSVFVGIETPDDTSLAECGKYQNRNRDLMACVEKIQRFGLRVRGGFIVGFDNDSPGIFTRQIEFIQKSRIITAMVGMLNAPRGTGLYNRLKAEGRLLKDVSGDNTDFSTNILPRMGYPNLAAGYSRVIRGIYSPRSYYERVKAFLRNYRPLERRKKYFHFGYIRCHFHYPGAVFKSMFLLGVKDGARRYYWKLMFWSLFRRPRLLPMAVTYSIYGFHFRKVFADHL